MSEHASRSGDHEAASAEQLASLRALVGEYQVCWEKRPEQAVVGGAMRQVGFVVEISAAHGHPHAPPVAGCPACAPPLRALEQIVAFVLPRGEHESSYQVQIRWGAMQYAPRRGNRPEVGASIHILHKSGADRPIDACEHQCLAEIVSGLQKLGAAEGAWPAFPAAG